MQSTERNLVQEDVPKPLLEGRGDRMSRMGLFAITLGLLAVVGLGVERFTGLVGIFPGTEVDQVNEQQSTERRRTFLALGPIQLTRVALTELQDALRSLNLPPAEQDRLMEQVMPSHIPKSESEAGPPPAMMPKQLVQEDAQTIPLAWITLWDTDAMDSDMVRLDSEGYSRTITLSKSPVTFAVPVPQRGVVNIAGIRDGGGGITVGVASGTSPVALPIMSEGQVIGIPVSIP